MNVMFRALKTLALATTSLALMPAMSYAQDDRDAAPSPSTGDIIVTANRTESLASKTPMALTAISGEGLREAGVAQPINLSERVPSLAVNRSRGGLNFTIRGVATSDTSEKGDSSTAFLLDGIYIARAPMRDAAFFDVGRVEVLRGPQGTLYGRNTTAGVISVVSNRPTFDFGATADGMIGNFNSYQASGALNVPINDNIAVRGAVNWERNGSYLDGGPQVERSYRKARQVLAGRLSTLFKWDTGELVIRGDYADISGANFYSLPLSNFYRPATIGQRPIYTGGGKSASELLALDVLIPFPQFRKNSTWGVSADLTQELGPVTVFYLGSYRAMDRDEQFASILANGVNASRVQTRDHTAQQSHEVRAALTNGGPLQLQVGAFYFREETDVTQRFNVTPTTTRDGEAGTTLLFDIDPTIAQSYAFFGQGTYSISDALRVTGGVRYTHDKKTRRGFGNVVCTNNFFNCNVPAGASQTDRSDYAGSKVTWKLGADYDLAPGTMVYATVATGYKAGGFNNGCVPGTGPGCNVPADTLYFEPETLTSYEGGIKARLAGNAVQLNLSAFHYDYQALQLTQAITPCPTTPGIPTSTCTFTKNAAKAKIDGVEIEATLVPSSLDRVDFSITYLNARYASFEPRPGFDLKGEPLNRAPKWAASAGYQHTFMLGGDYELVAGARTRISDEYFLFYDGGVNFYRQPSFTQTDVTLTFNAPDRRWYVQGFAKNLENNVIINDLSSGAFQSVSVNEPRTYGVRGGFKF